MELKSMHGGNATDPVDNRRISLAIEGAALGPSREWQLVWAFVLLGLFTRTLRYVLRFPLWEDECFLCVNFIDRGYAELLDPLQYHQVAPVGFLWIELALTRLLGYNELTLRLFPFACSVAGLFLLRHVASRLLAGWPLVFAVGVFAVSYPAIRYAAEAKQYSSDMLVGLAYFAMTVEWWRTCEQEEAVRWSHRWLIAMAVFTPFAVGLSYPAVFAAGSASLFVAVMLLKETSRNNTTVASGMREVLHSRSWQLWAAFNGILISAFLALLFVVARKQSSAELEWMASYWQHAFPPLAEPWKLPLWFLDAHAGHLLAFPVGWGRGASVLTFLSVVLGIGYLVRRRAGLCLLLMLTSPALHLIAAAMERYPYGGQVKFSMHMAGIICMISGLGTAVLISWCVRISPHARKMVPLVLTYLLLIAVTTTARSIVQPGKSQSDIRARAFAEWFWFNASFDGEAVCVKSDLGESFSPESYEELSWVAQYLVNKEIYAPRRGSIETRLANVSQDHPLRCVIYRDLRYEFDEPKQQKWLVEMERQYELEGRETFAFPRYKKNERDLETVDRLEIYSFVPKTIAEADANRNNAAVRK